jgi:hypothetical protein
LFFFDFFGWGAGGGVAKVPWVGEMDIEERSRDLSENLSEN